MFQCLCPFAGDRVLDRGDGVWAAGLGVLNPCGFRTPSLTVFCDDLMIRSEQPRRGASLGRGFGRGLSCATALPFAPEGRPAYPTGHAEPRQAPPGPEPNPLRPSLPLRLRGT